MCQAEEELKNNSVKQESKIVEDSVENKPSNLIQSITNFVVHPVHNEPSVVECDEDIKF